MSDITQPRGTSRMWMQMRKLMVMKKLMGSYNLLYDDSEVDPDRPERWTWIWARMDNQLPSTWSAPQPAEHLVIPVDGSNDDAMKLNLEWNLPFLLQLRLLLVLPPQAEPTVVLPLLRNLIRTLLLSMNVWKLKTSFDRQKNYLLWFLYSPIGLLLYHAES